CLYSSCLFHSFPTRRSSDLVTVLTTPPPSGAPRRADDSCAAPPCASGRPRPACFVRVGRSTAAWCGPYARQRRLHRRGPDALPRSEEHTSELQSRFDLVCRL